MLFCLVLFCFDLIVHLSPSDPNCATDYTVGLCLVCAHIRAKTNCTLSISLSLLRMSHHLIGRMGWIGLIGIACMYAYSPVHDITHTLSLSNYHFRAVIVTHPSDCTLKLELFFLIPTFEGMHYIVSNSTSSFPQKPVGVTYSICLATVNLFSIFS